MTKEDIRDEAISLLKCGASWAIAFDAAIAQAYELGRKEATNPDRAYARPGQGAKI